MQELRLVAVSEDGSYAVMVAPGRSGRFALPIDERLRTIARGQFSRLAQYEIEVENPLRPKEIQDRIRAGETAEEIADAAGLPIERVRRFEGPVLAEREFRAQEAQRATVRGHSDHGPGPRLGEIVSARLSRLGCGPADAEWDSRKRADGNWHLRLALTIGGCLQIAEWVYDPLGKHVTPANEQAARLCLPENDWPAADSGSAAPAAATVTPIGSRHGPGNGHPGHDWLAASGTAASARPEAASMGMAQPSGGDGDAGDRITGGAAELTAAELQAQRRADLLAKQAPGGHADEPSAEQSPASRRARRAAGGRPRRSSVPSWDEIMFGTSRPGD